jgi:glycosyltransferase involved in cell wall biosynthesis
MEALAVETPTISTDCNFGPREILAPDLKIDKKIGYPYKTNRGVLISNKDPGPIWKSPEEVPLTETERQLANAIINQIKSDKIYSYEISEFDTENIIKQWEDLM